MKRNSVSVLLVVLFSLFAITLIGCGGSDGSDGSDGGGGGGGGGGGAPVYQWDPVDFTNVYHVGPNQTYAEPGDVPWESIGPSSLVMIHYRATPYRAKWVINIPGTVDEPVVILGVEENGFRPVISGDDAVTPTQLNYWNENRSVIKVGGSSTPNNPSGPSYIYIQGLDIRSARPAYSFTDDNGSSLTYNNNAASIHVEEGQHIFIIDCVLHDSGNGLFATWMTTDLVVSGNAIYDNGIENSYYEHNSYTSAKGITFEYNYYGPLRANCLGNNLKDRSAGTVIRYNWIEAGNRQLDLVDAGNDTIYDDPTYDETFVYGNILVESDDTGNSQILHYGGDSGNTNQYRNGVLYFYNNTVVSTRSGNTTLARLSTNTQQGQFFNNVVYTTASGSRLAILNSDGQVTLEDNWLPTGWGDSHSGLTGTITNLGNFEGTDPGFSDFAAEDFTPTATSDLRGLAGGLPAAVSAHPVSYQYVEHQGNEQRPDDGDPDAGAFEYAP